MLYLLSPIESHPDYGFGITADAYFMAAEGLKNNDIPENKATQQREMPQNYLYRHSIELYLKSLIIIFHKQLKIDYGTVPFNSLEPEIKINGKWIKLYRCHFIDELYEYWLKELVIPNKKKLNVVAKNGTWDEPKDITDLLPMIVKYDQDSSFFRYPVTKNTSLDSKKYTMQPLKIKSDINDVFQSMNDTHKQRGGGNIGFIKLNADDEIEEFYAEDKNILVDVRDALSKVASILYAIHIMSRCTLCDNL